MSENPYKNDPEQTAIAIAYKNTAFIADDIMPRVPVGKKSFTYNDFGKRGEFDLPDDTIGRKGRAQELEYGSEQKTATCLDRGYFAGVPNDDVDEAVKSSMPNPVHIATEKITKTIHRRREVRVAQKVFNPANYVHKEALTDATRLDVEDADVIPFLLERLDTPLIRPNIAVLGQGSWTKIRTNPKLLKAFNGNNGDEGAIPLSYLAELLELDMVYIGKARVNTAKLGKAAKFERAWDQHLAFHHRESVLSNDNEPTWGFTGQYGSWVTDEVDVRAGEMGVRGGKRVFAGETVEEVVCSREAGFLIENATL